MLKMMIFCVKRKNLFLSLMNLYSIEILQLLGLLWQAKHMPIVKSQELYLILPNKTTHI